MARILFTIVRLFTVILLFFTAGCSRQGNVPMTVETLPSGVIETTYTELPRRPLAVDTVAVWDVWSGEAGYLFSRLTAVVGFEDGFYVLDSGNRQVVETDLRGRVRNVFGQRGEGPGEFGYPRFLNIVADEVWVGDIMPMRFSIFGRDGSSISEEEIRRKWQFAEQRQAIGRIRIDPLGRIWVLAHTGNIERNRVDLFDPEHLYLGSFTAPVLPLAFAADGTAFLRAPDGPNGEGVFYTARVH